MNQNYVSSVNQMSMAKALQSLQNMASNMPDIA